MTDALSSAEPEVPAAAMTTDAASVVVAIIAVAGMDSAPTLESVAQQRHPVDSVYMIDADERDSDPGDSHIGAGLVGRRADLEHLVAELDADTEYVWILHGDAEARPDALGALVLEADRHDASLAGSKLLVAGTRDTLEGVGSATDVFGEPYSGLDEGEVDLEQYDVVRDVAFVSSVSMLVRRDLLRGLRGLDPLLRPVAAGLDLSQRIRVAGGRVMVVPSSEVFHHGRCGRGDGGWREQAGRLRAMIKAYRPITLLWMLPFAVATGILDSIACLMLGRWRLAPRYLMTWGWNIRHLPSTIGFRRNVSRVRQVGDEELFRYQVGGSVRLRRVGSELSDRLLGAFDEDRAVTRRAQEVWNSLGAWAALAAVLMVLVGVRAIFFGDLPVVGQSLPPSDSAASSLARFFGGWNRAGLGTDAAVHPATGAVALVQGMVLGNGLLAQSVVTLGAFLSGVFGVARLAARFQVGGAGAYVGGIVAMFGPVAALLAQSGSWAGLVGIGLLPWALATVVGPVAATARARIGAVGRAVLATSLVSFFVPVLAAAPLLFVLVVKAVGRFPVRLAAAAVSPVGGIVGAGFLLTRLDRLLDGVPLLVDLDVVAWALLALLVTVGMVAGSWRASAVAGIVIFGSLAVARAVGPHLQVGLLAAAAVATGLGVAAALKSRATRDAATWTAAAVAAAVLAVSLPGMAGGRAGMPADEWGRALSFTGLDREGVERTLLIAPDPAGLPGDSFPGPGFWFRTVEAGVPTLDQVALGPAGAGDEALRATLGRIVSGASLTPGEDLASFGVRWVVAVDDSAAELSPVLEAQVDLEPLPLAEGFAVYENAAVRPVAVADDGTAWLGDGTRFTGPEAAGTVRLAIQGDGRWRPGWAPDDWAGTVSAGDGLAWFAGDTTVRWLAIGGLGVMVAALGAVLLASGGRGGGARGRGGGP